MQKYRHPRKSDTTTVGDAISDMLKSYHLTERFDQKRLIESWESLMGKVVSNRTKKMFIKNKVLFIELTSAPLKNELNMSKDKVMTLFEEQVGKDIISDIIFM